VATAVLPVCLSPIMNSRKPRPIVIIESIGISPVPFEEAHILIISV